MTLKKLELSGFKSFGRKETLFFDAPVVAIVGPNGSGKSNVAEAFRWVLGEQSLKSLRGKKGEDLIFNGSSALARLSRASAVVTFDNRGRQFSTLDFDEVTISREVFRDGTNEYKINGETVRWRDIVELLAHISIGASGHHIISQGEADKILNANQQERRLMIEEALGLKIYQWKLAESEKKLAKTEENIKQVESIRREIAPHLKFLKKQMEKIERVRGLKVELKTLYQEYLKREEIYLQKEKIEITEASKQPNEEFFNLETKLNSYEPQVAFRGEIKQAEQELSDLEQELGVWRAEKNDLIRALGRLEGLLEWQAKGGIVEETSSPEVNIALSEFKKWLLELEIIFQQLDELKTIAELQTKTSLLRQKTEAFLLRYEKNSTPSEIARQGQEENKDFKETRFAYETKQRALLDLTQKEAQQQQKITDTKSRLIELRHKAEVAEHDFYQLKARHQEVETILQRLKQREKIWQVTEENFKQELGEAGILLGREVLTYPNLELSDEALTEDRLLQENRRRQIEKIKLRLEDAGIESPDVLKEHEEVTERDNFLAHELVDLTKSRGSLQTIMAELQAKIETEFSLGLTKINKEFQNFFSLLFGGGTASLAIWKPEARRKISELSLLDDPDLSLVEGEELKGASGIEIDVSLPRKKIKGLAMLSGGERALTSIALLFAMSQVNPPPFLILDETDAALDEANSRKYADMIENLSAQSQLILITHNRETMSRAGILYGVTMGADSVSRLISIKFDEAEQYAK